MSEEFFNCFAVSENEQSRLLGLKHGTFNCIFDALKSIEKKGQEMSDAVKEQIIIKIKNYDKAFSSKESEILYKTKDSEILFHAFKFLTKDVAVKVLQEGLIPAKKWREESSINNVEEVNDSLEKTFDYILDAWEPISYAEYRELLNIDDTHIWEHVLKRLSSFDGIVQLVMDDSLPKVVKKEIDDVCTDSEVSSWLDLSIKELCIDEMLTLFSHSYSEEVRGLLNEYVKFPKAMDYYIKHHKEDDPNANYDAFEFWINDVLSDMRKFSKWKKCFTKEVVNSLLKSDKLIEDGAILELCSKDQIIELAKDRYYNDPTAISDKLLEMELSIEKSEDVFFNAKCFIKSVAEKIDLRKLYDFVIDFPKKKESFNNVEEYNSYYTSLINHFSSQLQNQKADCFTDDELLKLLSIKHNDITKIAFKKMSSDGPIKRYLDKNNCNHEIVYIALEELDSRGFKLGSFIGSDMVERWLIPKSEKSK